MVTIARHVKWKDRFSLKVLVWSSSNFGGQWLLISNIIDERIKQCQDFECESAKCVLFLFFYLWNGFFPFCFMEQGHIVCLVQFIHTWHCVMTWKHSGRFWGCLYHTLYICLKSKGSICDTFSQFWTHPNGITSSFSELRCWEVWWLVGEWGRGEKGLPLFLWKGGLVMRFFFLLTISIVVEE